MRDRWSTWAVLALSGGWVFQLAACHQTAYETLVRIGFSTVFLPLNRFIAAALGQEL